MVNPDPSGWRSSVNYDRTERLTASDLAWEWLRRNEAYDRDYQDFKRASEDGRDLTEHIRRRWRLRNPGRPTPDAARDPHLLAA